MRKVGVWFIGARGSVATTATIGAAAVKAGVLPAQACVTESPDFPGGLVPIAGLLFGGHDITEIPLRKRAEQLSKAGVVPAGLPGLLGQDLDAADAEIRPGHAPGGDTQAAAAARLAGDIAGFRDRHRLDRVVVVNVSSTEPPATPRPEFQSLADLEERLDAGDDVLPTSSLYAYAAFRAGCGYVEFTPSPGPTLPALAELAELRAVPYAGRDAKTGETLVKSALAPMFAQRSLRVRSWSGLNLLGGGDGATLADPAARASKTLSKDRAVTGILGTPVEGETHIDYVEDLGEWKTAWDHVTFEGFLGVRMSLQFTWQGCDSALAAPLVLDLARLVARAHERGRHGVLADLGFFFKDPLGTDEHALAAQYARLRAFAEDLATEAS
ncbi:Inositol-1-phosphate synthase [[Actinomadura] parvosata subsp. kistnae]|uniref:Myo-inositol-1-phosphate synthase n=1 Tax=[Actinomadura] parvosata subsp. kistnae TaxID=1909395 RepID=A0A1U9ZWN1_9ACTN|nr:inositol-3-phosphate synthase [Nonomuraea sp. ATCC 55076]AQZ62319.1 myo-inositol-1-phosphate synthase [Nonomuraea sp. ATCC 55076]SPL99673.1 Inositol-1-phosphate synthase [Actinomadura parvosata subsp. kistnae]